MDQDTAIADLTKAVRELTMSRTQQRYDRPERKPRMQPRFTEDGQPIYFRCNGVGHIAKTCVRRPSEQPTSASIQGNRLPQLLRARQFEG